MPSVTKDLHLLKLDEKMQVNATVWLSISNLFLKDHFSTFLLRMRVKEDSSCWQLSSHGLQGTGGLCPVFLWGLPEGSQTAVQTPHTLQSTFLLSYLHFGVYLCVLNMYTFVLFDKHHFKYDLTDPKWQEKFKPHQSNGAKVQKMSTI